MDKILLISNEVMHYRQKIYNYFYDRFIKDGYDFQVIANSYQEVNYKLRFTNYEIPFSLNAYINKIKEIEPQVVILFLHIKDKLMLPIIYYCKSKQIPVIYWNHGINIAAPNNKLKNLFFRFIHNRCNALITYTPETRKYFSDKNQKKLFVAYNTLDFSDIDKNKLISKEAVKKKYGIKEKNVILFISRILPAKRADLLMELFVDTKDVAVVFVGPGLSQEQQKTIDSHSNLYYLGERYGKEVNEIYKMGDVFSTPGSIGLAVNEALFWGLPVVILKNGIHGPETYYLKDGITGYFAKDENDLKNCIMELFNNREKLKKMSENCLEVYNKEVSIEKMYQGFIDAVKYCNEVK